MLQDGCPQVGPLCCPPPEGKGKTGRVSSRHQSRQGLCGLQGGLPLTPAPSPGPQVPVSRWASWILKPCGSAEPPGVAQVVTVPKHGREKGAHGSHSAKKGLSVSREKQKMLQASCGARCHLLPQNCMGQTWANLKMLPPLTQPSRPSCASCPLPSLLISQAHLPGRPTRMGIWTIL